MKVLVTGGTSSFGKELTNSFPDSKAAGRGTGWNLLQEKDKIRLAEYSLDFDVFINYACYSPGHQLKILNYVASTWSQNNKIGLIINFGSINTFYLPKTESKATYVALKQELDQRCYDLAKQAIDGMIPYRITNLRPGFLKMERNKEKKDYKEPVIDANDIATLVNFIYKQPLLHFPDIVMEKPGGSEA